MPDIEEMRVAAQKFIAALGDEAFKLNKAKGYRSSYQEYVDHMDFFLGVKVSRNLLWSVWVACTNGVEVTYNSAPAKHLQLYA